MKRLPSWLLSWGVLLAASAAFAQGAAEKFESEVLSHGLLVTYGLAFVAGLGAVVSPCVYPLIPITLTIIGARGAERRGQAVANAAVYVLGMAAMYTVLGLIAASLGKIFGFTYQNPWVMGFVVAVFLAMSLSMFGVWELRISTAWTRRLTGAGGYAGVFAMGLVSGLVASPCTAPFLFDLLAYVGKSQDLGLGGSALFTFALGLGLPFLVLGAFSGAIARLPKSGPWMILVKYAFGAAMLGFAVYYLPYVIGETMAPVVGGGALVLLGAIAAFEGPASGWTDRVLRWGGALTIGAGLLFFGHGLRAATHALYGSAPTRAAQAEIPWIASEEEAAALARARRQPMLLDFWATWCAPCKVLEEKLLRHPDVVAEARRFTAAKVDCTKEDERIRALYRKYGVAGLPALVFAGADGRVRGDLTVKELMPVEDFVARMRQVR